MAGTFDFCDNSRVVQELPPEEPSAMSFNGWEFTSKPAVPYRRTFSVVLTGMRWYVREDGQGLDVTTDPKHNAGRLLDFYRANRRWDVFAFNHEYLGNIICKFAVPVTVPKSIPDSFGRIEDFEVRLLHYNPAFS